MARTSPALRAAALLVMVAAASATSPLHMAAALKGRRLAQAATNTCPISATDASVDFAPISTACGARARAGKKLPRGRRPRAAAPPLLRAHACGADCRLPRHEDAASTPLRPLQASRAPTPRGKRSGGRSEGPRQRACGAPPF
jgi:hypothetical protein